MSVVWWWMMSFSMLMSFHTSLVVTWLVPSEGVKASPLCVHLLGIRGMVGVTLGWNSSTEKLVVVPWVLVGGGSGAPAGGSAISPFLVAARYATTILYRQQYQQPQGPTASKRALVVPLLSIQQYSKSVSPMDNTNCFSARIRNHANLYWISRK